MSASHFIVLCFFCYFEKDTAAFSFFPGNGPHDVLLIESKSCSIPERAAESMCGLDRSQKRAISQEVTQTSRQEARDGEERSEDHESIATNITLRVKRRGMSGTDIYDVSGLSVY